MVVKLGSDRGCGDSNGDHCGDDGRAVTRTMEDSRAGAGRSHWQSTAAMVSAAAVMAGVAATPAMVAAAAVAIVAVVASIALGHQAFRVSITSMSSPCEALLDSLMAVRAAAT